jgi:hypothetical protein
VLPLLQVGREIWRDIVSGAAEARPQLLQRFLLLAHGDLKHFLFTYWCVLFFGAGVPHVRHLMLAARPA